jgi:hypothetical protein
MAMVAEHLTDLLEKRGFSCQVTTHSVWENYTQPPPAHLVLQLLPAFTPDETGCPVINIKPFLVDLDDPATLDKVLLQVQSNYPH